METTDSATVLLDCLQSRDLGANYAEIRKNLDREQDPSIQSWINEHLRPETLLTKHELTLYSALQKSGEAEILSSSQHIAVQKEFQEQEILKAIEDLQKSTKTVEKQTEKLRILQESVESIIRSDRRQNESRESAQTIQHRAWVAENSQIRTTIVELSQSLNYQISELESKCNNADLKKRDRASAMLSLDNKYLAGLQKLANDLVLGESDEENAMHQARDLCARLIKYIVEGVRTRLDTVYLAAIGEGESAQSGTSNEHELNVEALQSELESLYAEILPVAQMSVEQQYLERALRFNASQDTQESERTEKALDYMSNVIAALIDQIQAFANCAEEHQMYRSATSSIIKAIKTELDSGSAVLPTKSASPSRTRKPAKAASPIQSRAQRRRSSTVFIDEDGAPELQLLRNLGISPPVEQQTSDGTLAAHLQAALEDRATKLDVHGRNLQDASETSIGCHLHDAQVTSAMLKRSLLSETQYRTVRLLDTDVQEAVGMLESDVEDLQRAVGGVKLDALKERNIRRDKLVERWA